MEKTLSTEEAARLPGPELNEYINTLLSAACPVHMGSPVLADVDRIMVSADWPTGATTTMSIAAQPDVPRNITITLTDASNSCTGSVTVLGEDASGNVVSEVMTPLGTGVGKTLVGTKIFAKVTSIIVTDGAGGTPSTDVFVVGVGTLIGVPWTLLAAAAVLHVYLGGVRIASPVVAVGLSTSGIDVSAGTYDGTKTMLAFVKPTKRA